MEVGMVGFFPALVWQLVLQCDRNAQATVSRCFSKQEPLLLRYYSITLYDFISLQASA